MDSPYRPNTIYLPEPVWRDILVYQYTSDGMTLAAANREADKALAEIRAKRDAKLAVVQAGEDERVLGVLAKIALDGL